MQVDQGAFGHLRPIPDYLSASLREVSPEGFDAERELSKIAQAFEAAEEDLVQLLHEPLISTDNPVHWQQLQRFLLSRRLRCWHLISSCASFAQAYRQFSERCSIGSFGT